MFHVSTLIPELKDEAGQQIVRKRFVGNDITCIVFQEGGQFTSPIRSQFCSIYLIVSPVDINGVLHYKYLILYSYSRSHNLKN
jgi:hypothetical protein